MLRCAVRDSGICSQPIAKLGTPGRLRTPQSPQLRTQSRSIVTYRHARPLSTLYTAARVTVCHSGSRRCGTVGGVRLSLLLTRFHLMHSAAPRHPRRPRSRSRPRRGPRRLVAPDYAPQLRPCAAPRACLLAQCSRHQHVVLVCRLCSRPLVFARFLSPSVPPRNMHFPGAVPASVSTFISAVLTGVTHRLPNAPRPHTNPPSRPVCTVVINVSQSTLSPDVPVSLPM